MPRGRPSTKVPCEDCILRASQQQAEGMDLCDECKAKLSARQHQHNPGYHLENYAQQLIGAINSRDFNHSVWGTYAADVQSNLSWRFPMTYTIADHINTIQTIVAESPRHYIQIENINSNVDAEANLAEVYIVCRITGESTGIDRGVHSTLRWSKRFGRWVCIAHTCIGMGSSGGL